MSIENRFEAGKAVALGAGISEMFYSGIAFVGFGTMSTVIRRYEMVPADPHCCHWPLLNPTGCGGGSCRDCII